jgi:hypothetical protein
MSTLIQTPTPLTLKASVSVPANTKAGAVVATDMTLIEGQPTTKQQTVPTREVWHIYDIYALATTTPDMAVQLVIDGIPQPFTVRISEIQQTSIGKFKLPATVPIPAGSTFGFNVIPTADVGGSAVPVTFYVNIRRFPIRAG